MAAVFDVGLVAEETELEELAKPLPRPLEILLRIQRPEHVIGFHPTIKGRDQGRQAVGSDLAGHDFDAVFYPGGHGPLWDLAGNADSQHLIERLYAAGKPVGAVCHGVAALREARGPFGLPLVRGKHVTGFSDEEETAVGLTDEVPFSVEHMLKAHGGIYSAGPAFQPHVVTEGLIVTGQNPASSVDAAKALLGLLS